MAVSEADGYDGRVIGIKSKKKQIPGLLRGRVPLSQTPSVPRLRMQAFAGHPKATPYTPAVS